MFKFIKQNIKFIVVLFFIVFLFYFHLPYYIMAPGGTIDISDRVVLEEEKEVNGSLNLLYATQYQANIPLYLLSFVLDSLDRESIEEEKIGNETIEEINLRNKYLLNNSINNALYVAYQALGKELEVKNKKNIILAVMENSSNDFKVGDILLSVDGRKIEDLSMIKNLEEKSSYQFVLLRNEKEITITAKKDQDGKLGIVLVTDYEFDTEGIELNFKESESGSSGGLMLSLSIYNALSNEDIVKGRKIAGTGTIDMDGTVGEIGGVKYKLIGAVRNHVDLMLVPEENYEECISLKEKYHYDILIVKVHTFEDALNYLREN